MKTIITLLCLISFTCFGQPILHNRYTTNTDSAATQFNRLRLTGQLTYFVATTGNDSNSGTNITSPLLTIQAAVNKALTWDFNTNNITIQVSDGIYSGSVLVQDMVANTDWKDSQGILFIHGDDASPTSVTITNASTNHLVMAAKGSSVLVGSLCVGSTNLPNLNLFDSQLYSTLAISNIVMGPVTAGNPQIIVEGNSYFYTKGPITSTGGGANFLLVLGPSDAWVVSNVTFSGSPTYTGGIFKAINNGAIYVVGAAFSGTVTGSKYTLFNSGTIATLGGGNPDTILPGNSAGSSGIGLTEGATNIFLGQYQLSTSGPIGVIDGSSAVSGVVGEFINRIVLFAAATNLITNVATNLASISLTPGDWDVEGSVNFTSTAATVGETRAAISTVSGTLPADGTSSFSGSQSTLLTISDTIPLTRIRVNTTITTNVFLVCNATFSAGTIVAYGNISARRMR